MPDAEKEFFKKLNDFAETAKGNMTLAENPDMALLFTVKVYMNKTDTTTHASEVSLEYDVPVKIIGLELLQVATRLIETKGAPRDSDS